MKQLRKKIVIGVMMPAVMALIVLERTMRMPSMNGVAMPNIEALLLTGMLLGIAISQGVTAFRRPPVSEVAERAKPAVVEEQTKLPLAS